MHKNSEHPFSDKLNQIADDMGVAMYQRFSQSEGALFLRCSTEKVRGLIEKNSIRYIELPEGQVEFFGFQLLEYLLDCVSGGEIPTPTKTHPDKIVRAAEVIKITGLSRTTIWRMERAGNFPARVPLNLNSVGWRMSEVQEWVLSR